MLRPFKHIHSKFYKIQSFVNHLFLDVVFKAPHKADEEFTAKLVNDEFKGLINEVDEEYILNPIKECYKICKTLSRQNLKKLRRGIHINNNIRLLCNGELHPLEYQDIDKINKNLSKQLKLFFDNIYDFAIKKAVFYNRYEKIDEYCKKLVGRNSKCRCCGINRVLTKFHSKRSALDHYLPRKHYPFISVNCNNLLPICDICNSKYKLGENTLFEVIDKGKKSVTKIRKKAFYPYSRITPYPSIDINITFKKDYTDFIEPEDLEINFECKGYEEQVVTWDRLFGIKENYLAECCTDNMYTFYEEEYIAQLTFNQTPNEYIDLLKKNKYGDTNFLKIAFLNGLNNYK